MVGSLCIPAYGPNSSSKRVVISPRSLVFYPPLLMSLFLPRDTWFSEAAFVLGIVVASLTVHLQVV